MMKKITNTGRWISDFHLWKHVDVERPNNGSVVLVCDADFRGWADYEFKALYVDNGFFIGRLNLQGVTYWRYQ
jgi:hypothetical protein